MDLAAAVSGAAYSLGSGVAHRRYVASLFPGTDSAAVAQHVAFKEPQGALGYFFFREGRGTVPAHPLYQSLRSMLTAIPAEVERRVQTGIRPSFGLKAHRSLGPRLRGQAESALRLSPKASVNPQTRVPWTTETTKGRAYKGRSPGDLRPVQA
eukprot:366553-Chlamydomonas_euryale.AAC.8